ncbi:conserved hypothetical protein [Leishmania mexicana MHOM/GT/2001/U1103]|uniref:Uncharacterized protein n=1 Tax=Leishmania mexicana (strain MHOM/GT/2001/U1103) TaxID=929439 RepID=E9AWT8_LEIMU|nr:conserved hypothetical protein [Leishmania mexicana MHOM/GT/2001/U1103]CBZ27424.1 conserved hypothetical protein [Leishmania mexicana MHOM/GT/2001/U1103]
MRDTDITFCLFPLGVGDTDVTIYGEAPLLLTASASIKAIEAMSSPPVIDVGGGTALCCTARGVAGRKAKRSAQQSRITLAASPSSGAPHQDQNAAPVEAVVDLTAAAESCFSATAANMHFIAANHLSQLQRGAVLARSSGTAGLLEPSTGYVECCGERRCYYVYPVEDRRYAAAVMLPAVVWRRLGGGGDGAAYAEWLVHTALRGSVVSANRVISGDLTTCAAHPPLHTRLLGSPHDVHRSMEAQVRLLADVVLDGTAQPRVFAERHLALRRMCREQPSPLRTLPRLWRRIEELLRVATSSTDAASLRGVMPTMGLPSTNTRYVLAASAVWYRGNPLYNSSSPIGAACRPAQAAELLRSAALSAVLKELKNAAEAASRGKGSVGGVAYASADDATTRLTAVCLLTRAPNDSEGNAGTDTRVSGYVSAPMRITSSAQSAAGASSVTSTAALPLVSLAFTSASGWTVALLLRGMRTPFLGAPLSSIFSGVQVLVEEHFESAVFVSLVSEATAAMRMTWRRPVTLLSPLMAQLEAAILDIRVGRRGGAAAAAAAPTRTRDVLLYYFNHNAAAAAAARESATVSDSSCSPPPSLLSRRCRAAHGDPTSGVLRLRCALGEGEAFGLAGSQTVHGGGAAVEAVLQAAARYAQLAARVQRCCRGAGAKSRRLGGCGASPPPLYAQRRCQTVHSVLSGKDVTRVVQAVPHCTSWSGGVAGRAAEYAVTYAVVVLETKTTPELAHDEYRAFTSWLLRKCC